LRAGWRHVGGEEVYFIPNPALGLWAHRGRFFGSDEETIPSELVRSR